MSTAQWCAELSFLSHCMRRNHAWTPYALVMKNCLKSQYNMSHSSMSNEKKKNKQKNPTFCIRQLPLFLQQLPNSYREDLQEELKEAKVPGLLFIRAPRMLRWLQGDIVLDVHLNQKKVKHFISLLFCLFFISNSPCWLQRSGQCWRYGCSFPLWQGYLKHKQTGLGPYPGSILLPAMAALTRNAWIWFEAASHSASIQNFKVTCAQIIKEE